MRFFLLIMIALTVPASQATADVLATVDDSELTWDDVVRMIGGEENAQLLGVTTSTAATEVLESWVREEVMVRAATASGLESYPDVAFLIEQAVRQILLEAYMAEIVEPLQVSQLEKENYVAEWFDTYTKSIHAEHIIVADENLANSLLAQVQGGADFAQLAFQYSIGPSAGEGGSLGWITRGQSGYMSFDEAAFALEPGEISGVIETRAGFHIIRVLEVEPLDPVPTLEEVTEFVGMELEQAMQEEAIMDKVEELRATHAVQLFPDRLLLHLE
jgi:peptidyl-prolyl cis-trans isomerase C